MNIEISGYTLKNLASINVILGKNGCGKSTLLRQISRAMSVDAVYGAIKYITPERGGALVYEPNVDNNVMNSQGWMADTRNSNQFNQFRQQTVSQYRTLETEILRAVEAAYKAKTDGAQTFDMVLDQVNSLLDNIRIEAGTGGPTFKIFSKATNDELKGESISSGESELISLAIESLTFSRALEAGKDNILILDEPDVHLHPDLQARLTAFLKQLVDEFDFTVLMATHSTSMLGNLADGTKSAVALMKSGDKELDFRAIDDVYKRILPVFGAHPLSNVFNEAPLLLVEGEDDQRIWQQAVRSGNGKIKLYPVDCGSVSELNKHETLAAEIVNAVYDNAIAYSLRDRDEGPEEIADIAPVIRMRLHCRAAENLMLSDDVLTLAGTDWDAVKAGIEAWITANPDHSRRPIMEKFRDEGFDRLGFDLKDIRQILVGAIIDSNKPWEVLVGQAIAQMTVSSADHSLSTYLGKKTCESLLK